MDSGWDLDLYRSFLGYVSGAPAGFAGVFDDLALPTALRAGRDHLEEAAEAGLLHLASAAAYGALRRVLAAGTACSGTIAADVLSREFDGLVGAFGDLVEGQLDSGLQVVAANGAAAPAGS